MKIDRLLEIIIYFLTGAIRFFRLIRLKIAISAGMNSK